MLRFDAFALGMEGFGGGEWEEFQWCGYLILTFVNSALP